MRKSLLILFSILFFACSSDDSSTDEHGLVSILEKMDGTNNNTRLYEYSGQKLRKKSQYSMENLVRYTVYLYNDNGLLISTKEYDHNDVLMKETSITYDNQNRIIKTKRLTVANPDFPIITDFTHNSDNTITSVEVEGPMEFRTTYEKNDNGVIIRQIGGGETMCSVSYDNLRPLTVTSYGDLMATYSYSSVGMQPLPVESMFGSHLPNLVLFWNRLDETCTDITRDLISGIAYTHNADAISYTFNTDNYPLTKTITNDGFLVKEYIYTYQ